MLRFLHRRFQSLVLDWGEEVSVDSEEEERMVMGELCLVTSPAPRPPQTRLRSSRFPGIDCDPAQLIHTSSGLNVQLKIFTSYNYFYCLKTAYL